jgi:2-(1,2-epoxy-1,2-dihydrophenyl)acetyl-CoA isomerase
MRRNIADAMDGTYTQALQREAAGQRLAGGSGDAMEGAMAFLQKRKAAFRGA